MYLELREMTKIYNYIGHDRVAYDEAGLLVILLQFGHLVIEI